MSHIKNTFSALAYDSDSDGETKSVRTKPQIVSSSVKKYIDNDALVLCYNKKSTFNKTIYQGKYKETMKTSPHSYKSILSSQESKTNTEVTTTQEHKGSLEMKMKSYEYTPSTFVSPYSHYSTPAYEDKREQEYIEEMETVMSDGEFQEWYAEYKASNDGYDYDDDHDDDDYHDEGYY